MTDLRTYLNARRTGNKDVFKDLNKKVLRESAQFARSILANAEDNKVVFTRTIEKNTEVVALPTGSFLIFDLQLSSAFRTLTHILNSGVRHTSAQAYFGKLLAEEGLMAKRADIVDVGFQQFETLTPLTKVNARTDQPAIYNYTSLNDIFVLLHEQAHLALKQDNGLEPIISEFGRLGITSGLAQDWQVQTRARYAHLFANVNLLESHIFEQERREQYVRDNQRLLKEELACDTTAISIMTLFCEANRYPVIEACRSTILCLRHLRVIAHIRAFVREICRGLSSSVRDASVGNLDIRIHRAERSSDLTLKHHCPENYEVDISELRKVGLEYTEFIDHQLLHVFFPFVRNSLLNSSPFYLFPRRAFQACLNKSEEYGWLPRSTRTPYLALNT